MPYFIYDIYAMFLCHWHKHQVKGHGGDEGEARAPGSTWAVARGYLHKEFLMVLHHAVMVLVCFPLSVVSPVRGSLGPGGPVPARAGPGWRAPGGSTELQPGPRLQEGLGQPARRGPARGGARSCCDCQCLSLSFLVCNPPHAVSPTRLRMR